MLPKKHLIYGLVDPLTNELRYVGRSSSGLKRPRRHWKDREFYLDYYSSRWVRSLIEQGVEPEILILEDFEPTNDINEVLNEAEVFWIAYFRFLGARLTNADAGGKVGQYSEERRQKISVSGKGRKHTAEAKAKMSAALKGKKFSEEHKANIAAGARRRAPTTEQARLNMSLAGKGKKRSPQARANISAGKKGKKFSKEHCDSMSKVRMGHVVPEETKAKISSTMSGKKKSDQHRENMSRAAKNRKYSEEGRAKMSAAKLKWWENKRRLDAIDNGLVD